MKKIILTLLFLILIFPLTVFGKEKSLNIYLFYGDGCPHCAAEEKYLNKYLKDHKNIKLYKYEVWHNKENAQKFIDIHEKLNDRGNGIPYLIIGSNTITGYDDEVTPQRIVSTINYYLNMNYKDEVGIYLGVVDPNETGNEEGHMDGENSHYSESEFDIPIIGKKNAKDVPILLSAIIIGLVDGFNPCAMWILIFLISMLLGMKDKKRMWILGLTFLVSSALVYFLFLISWLNLAIFLNKVVYIRLGIAMIAVIFGGISVLRFVNRKEDDGCEVVDTKKRKRIITSIKKIVKEKSFPLAILGIILLAVSVNVIELLCSLGLPVMFTEILAINEVKSGMQLFYSIIYVFFFLIDDIIIFVIAMKTLEIKAISNKYGKYAHLIGGIIMLIIGFLMIFKPEWIMFNF